MTTPADRLVARLDRAMRDHRDDQDHRTLIHADDLRAVLAELRRARGPLVEPDAEHDGRDLWLVSSDLDVTLDATGRDRPTYRVGARDLPEVTVRALHAALGAALARGAR